MTSSKTSQVGSALKSLHCPGHQPLCLADVSWDASLCLIYIHLPLQHIIYSDHKLQLF